EFKNSDDFKKIVQYASLISAFHLRRSPIDKTMVKSLSEGKILDDFKYPSNYKFLNDLTKVHNLEGKIMYLDDFADGGERNQLKFATALLRILDSIDKGVHRVGRVGEEDARMQTTIEDILYCIRETIGEVDSIIAKNPSALYSKSPGESLSMLKAYLIKFENWVKSSYINLLFQNNKAMRNISEFEDTHYLELYEGICTFSRQKDHFLNDIRRGMNATQLSKLDSLLEQIGYLIDCPFHHYSHRTVKEPTIRKDENDFVIRYEFNENFVKIRDLNFVEFNRLFQESWRICTDIWEEYDLVKHVLEQNQKGIKFSNIEFVSYGEGGKETVWFSFPMDLDGMVEIERKISFNDDADECERFVGLLVKEGLISNKPFQKTEIEDEFFDIRSKNGYLLKDRGWTIRKRKINNCSETIGIKIAPVFWRRDYEYCLEFPEINIQNIQFNKKLSDFFDALHKINIQNIQFNKFFAT
ncbi:MAG: hypothetical protein ACUVQP_04965, partial [Bacteroidales bacterium]